MIFGVHGALWGNAMTWWDHETGSIWSQPLGEAIAGPLKGARVEQYPVSFTTWESWRTSHPDTLALDVPAGRSGFDLAEMLIVVDFGSEAAGYPVTELRRSGVINDVVAGLEIAVISDPGDPNQWAVLSRRLDDGIVELRVLAGEVRDTETNSVWDPLRGIARSGRHQGEILDLLPGFTAFPGDFDTFWPEGRVWQQ